jgi:hypothetical protein
VPPPVFVALIHPRKPPCNFGLSVATPQVPRGFD